MRLSQLTRWCGACLLAAATVRGAAAEPPTGQITGSVRLEGRPPPITWYAVEHDREICGTRARPAQALVLGTNQAVRDVIVYLGAPAQPVPPSPSPIVLDQQHCDLLPRIQIAARGAPLIVQNSDPVLHVLSVDLLNATNAPQPLLRVAAPYAGFEKKFALPDFHEPVMLRATGGNGHEWMTAYVAVLPHPWAALTDAWGRFVIRSVPPGHYKLYAWHELLGVLVRDVTVAANGPTVADLKFRGAE